MTRIIPVGRGDGLSRFVKKIFLAASTMAAARWNKYVVGLRRRAVESTIMIVNVQCRRFPASAER